MPAEKSEHEAAEREGVEFEFLTAPVEVLRKKDKLAGLRCQRMKLGEPDDSGRKRPVPIDGSEAVIDADLVLTAVGQDGNPGPGRILGLEVDATGRVVADPVTLATKRSGVFAGGDAVNGPWTVIDAIAAGKRAAWGIDVFLRGKHALPLDLPASRPDKPWTLPDAQRIPREARVWPCEAPSAPAESSASASASTSTSTKEGSSTSTTTRLRPAGYGVQAPTSAQAEAMRCLACGKCGHCLACIETFACPAIVVTDGRVTIDAAACNGCSVCAQLCPNGAIEAVP